MDDGSETMLPLVVEMRKALPTFSLAVSGQLAMLGASGICNGGLRWDAHVQALGPGCAGLCPQAQEQDGRTMTT